jgi:CBS domain-containing protein
MKTAQQILNDKKHNDILSIEPDRPVIDALIIMAEYKIGALLVMQNNKLLGIISERDYAREIVLKGKSSKQCLVEEVMTKAVITIDAKDTYDMGLEIMTENRIRHLPVVENKKVVGMLSLGDLAKETIIHQRLLIDQLESFIKS